jgi:hypothetical protein
VVRAEYPAEIGQQARELVLGRSRVPGAPGPVGKLAARPQSARVAGAEFFLPGGGYLAQQIARGRSAA